jgi:hypothetical protein
MKFIIVHGPPAVGKLTTARCLQRLTGYKVLHNHLTFNVARTLFDIGDPRHIDLHRDLRQTMIEHAAKSDLAGVILTLVYCEPESVAVIEQIKSVCAARGIELLGVFLQCEVDELHRRVVQPERTENGKLDSSRKLDMLLQQHDYVPIPDLETLTIDITDLPPQQTSALIVDRFISSAGGPVGTW